MKQAIAGKDDEAVPRRRGSGQEAGAESAGGSTREAGSDLDSQKCTDGARADAGCLEIASVPGEFASVHKIAKPQDTTVRYAIVCSARWGAPTGETDFTSRSLTSAKRKPLKRV